ncbi:DNA-binding Xre family transcriptional regulator [Tahibacter aquaticus]|uniref:DNA-binding Xre family transcriptional regulator n=1 Tax=Tahibacter aquaticus TaxID=520092 RepID=A0A4R6YTR8_9GAMM|nr:helix-turn-helix transcriptional regulator [Tahibacter aquaticus]TDR41736.1 DNA-binding Xre family transcriptional regulator [Tahibacter aquaticus]
MSAGQTLVNNIRAVLRQRGITYKQLAQLMELSEPTIKRDLSRGDFSLSRLDRICEVLELSLSDLLDGMPAQASLQELSEAQERALVQDPQLLLLTYLLVNDWKLAEIERTYSFDESQMVSLLLRLDELRIVDYRPPRRIKKLTARNFSWRKDGPVHAFFLARVAGEFLRAPFDDIGDEFRFLSGMLSVPSRTHLKAVLQRIAQEFDELARQDARLPLAQRDGFSLMLALRKWEFSEFTQLRRARHT